jgi:phosphatidylethanolamine-binding protein (PEBP) family uncharacterized protein
VGTNDAGQARYVGPCPPAGDIRHRYELTVYALDVASLEIPAETTPAFAAFTIGAHVIGYGRLVGTAQR